MIRTEGDKYYVEVDDDYSMTLGSLEYPENKIIVPYGDLPGLSELIYKALDDLNKERGVNSVVRL